MEKRIIKELKGRKPSEIKVLSLDHCRAKTISGLTDEFSQLTALYLEYVGLTSLDGLPKLPALHTIELGDNKLTGGLEILVENCPRLRFIDLSANKIKTIETLEPLKNLSELSELDLFECRVTKLPNYRKDVFTLLPQIKYLDGFDINDRDCLSDESEDDKENFGDDKFNSDYEEVFEKKVDGKLNNFQTKLSLVESKNKKALEILEKKMNEEIQKLKSEHQNEIKNLKESFQQLIEEKIKETKETQKIDELEEDRESQKSDLSSGFELLTYNENKL